MMRVRMVRLRSVGRISTIYMPMRLTTLATQKKKPLMTKELIFSFSISTKASDTKELKPALSTMMTKTRKTRFWNKGTKRDSWMIMAASRPATLRTWMTRLFSSWKRFLMKEPRLLKRAEDRLAARPISAMSFSVSF
jgi:hypothetical protein